jgi:RNA polymerase sporulation-specific sigma factor
MDQIGDNKNTEENWVKNIALKDAVKRLTQKEKEIIMLRFYDGRTQMEVAKGLGISQAQVSRLEKNALRNMKNYLSYC